MGAVDRSAGQVVTTLDGGGSTVVGARELEGRSRGFQFRVRRSLLARSPLEADGSASLAHLARRAVVGSRLPCPVEVVTNGEVSVALFRLSGEPFRFSLVTAQTTERRELEDFADPAQLGWSEQPTNTVAVPTRLLLASGPEVYFALESFEHAVGDEVDIELTRLQGLLNASLRVIGLRSVTVPTAGGEPDPRIRTLRRGPDPTKGRPLLASDLSGDMNGVPTSVVVPDGIESILQMARLLYVHGWTEWQFFTAAEHYALLAIEASLRALYEDWLGEVDVVLEGQQRGDATRVRRPIPPRYEALRVASQDLRGARVNGLPLPRANAHFLSHAVHSGAMSQWEKRQCDNLLSIRNILSHPEFAQIHGIGDVRRTIRDAATLINLMWCRRRGEVPREIAWDPLAWPWQRR
jgi:hypothetical protein